MGNKQQKYPFIELGKIPNFFQNITQSIIVAAHKIDNLSKGELLLGNSMLSLVELEQQDFTRSLDFSVISPVTRQSKEGSSILILILQLLQSKAHQLKVFKGILISNHGDLFNKIILYTLIRSNRFFDYKNQPSMVYKRSLISIGGLFSYCTQIKAENKILLMMA
ncbi:UNKNOWN [Stylonychia lemnae]|uniref:Uncharacterized protein n=1 Tax=Stylonychia lemnae TaxID=5949 RepID=A0A078A5D6_STYLE|nr:UNKNOWN [Stylonychia lemnae]|eukprot:CDW77379.1 UNKNOWN [Stylonychia lemnae]